MTFTSRRRCSVYVARRIIFLAPQVAQPQSLNALLMRTGLRWKLVLGDTKRVILPSLVMVDGRTVDSKSIAKTVRFVTQENEPLRRARGQTNADRRLRLRAAGGVSGPRTINEGAMPNAGLMPDGFISAGIGKGSAANHAA